MLGLSVLQHLEDLVADQLLALEQLVAQRHDEVAVRVEQVAHVRLGLLEDALDRAARLVVGEHLGDDARACTALATASKLSSVPAMPNEPTICAASVVAFTRSLLGPVPDSPKNSSSAVMPPKLIWIDAISSERVRV